MEHCEREMRKRTPPPSPEPRRRRPRRRRPCRAAGASRRAFARASAAAFFAVAVIAIATLLLLPSAAAEGGGGVVGGHRGGGDDDAIGVAAALSGRYLQQQTLYLRADLVYDVGDLVLPDALDDYKSTCDEHNHKHSSVFKHLTKSERSRLRKAHERCEILLRRLRALRRRIRRERAKIRARRRREREAAEANKQPARPSGPVEEFKDEVEVYDTFEVEIDIVCGDKKNGKLSSGRKAALERALLDYFNGRAGCDDRTDEVYDAITLVDFAEAEICDDISSGIRRLTPHLTEESAATEESEAGRARALQTSSFDPVPDPDPNPDTGKKKKLRRRKKLSVLRANRRKKCTRCTKERLAADRRLQTLRLRAAAAQSGTASGERDDDTLRFVSIEEDAIEEDPLPPLPPPTSPLPPKMPPPPLVSSSYTIRSLQQDPQCKEEPPNLPDSLKSESFDDVESTNVTKVDEHDCFTSKDCRNPDGRCCGVSGCKCGKTSSESLCLAEGCILEGKDNACCQSDPDAQGMFLYPQCQPTCECLAMPFVEKNQEYFVKEGNAAPTTFARTIAVGVGGFCPNDVPGASSGLDSLSPSSRSELSSILLTHAAEQLSTGPCADEGISYDTAKILDFARDPRCDDPSREPDGRGSWVLARVGGTCRKALCVNEIFP